MTDAERREAFETAARLEAMKRRLAPLWDRQRRLRQALARTYPHLVRNNEKGFSDVYVTAWAPATDERLQLRAELDTTNRAIGTDYQEYRRLRDLDKMYKRLTTKRD